MIRYFFLSYLIATPVLSISQNFKLLFGAGFVSDTCIVNVSYSDAKRVIDTIVFHEIITTKQSLGFANSAVISVPKSNSIMSIEIELNGRVAGTFTYDAFRKGDELLIDYNRNYFARCNELGLIDEEAKALINGIPLDEDIYPYLTFFLRQRRRFKFE